MALQILIPQEMPLLAVGAKGSPERQWRLATHRVTFEFDGLFELGECPNLLLKSKCLQLNIRPANVGPPSPTGQCTKEIRFTSFYNDLVTFSDSPSAEISQSC